MLAGPAVEVGLEVGEVVVAFAFADAVLAEVVLHEEGYLLDCCFEFEGDGFKPYLGFEGLGYEVVEEEVVWEITKVDIHEGRRRWRRRAYARARFAVFSFFLFFFLIIYRVC